MPKINTDHIHYISEILRTSSFPSLLSMALVDMNMEEAILETTIEEKHRQLHGVVHGGMLASLIDTAAFWAVYFASDAPDIWYTSVDLNVKYLSPASSGCLTTRGKRIKVGKKLLYAEAFISDEKGRLIAHGTSSLIYLPAARLNNQSAIPPKFL